MKQWLKKKQIQKDAESKDWEKDLSKSKDYKKTSYINRKTNMRFSFTFIATLVDEKILRENALPFLLDQPFTAIDDVKKIIPVAEVEISEDPSDIEKKLFSGYVMLTVEKEPKRFAFILAQKNVTRTVTPPEVEFSVIGPKESFVEAIDQNLNMVRKRIPIKELVVDEIIVGDLSKSKVCVLYIDGIANPENVNTVKERIKNIDFDEILDSAYIAQLITDNQNSPFPQLLDTERPDRVAAVLAEGKVAVLVNGSPHAIIGPTTLVEFFSSFEDYLLNWYLASFFRLIRLFSVAFSVLVTPVYVAVLSYHYELIPKDLLTTLVTSRRVVPLPPILEALFLELTIELLREAGARLPTKVGQTIGIVGGIVIGTASVEAGLTSNVLLIIVALAALASFTTPIYRIGNTIRLLRFPFLLFAELWGLIGIVFCFCLLITHLLRLTSLERPFLAPLYPPRAIDFRDALIRLPFEKQALRPLFLRPEDPVRFNANKGNKKKDIDE
ncbi:spore germination protein [Bacillus sp. V3-13]|uniref:spore germination protein n=1 Tax=Bacillus sp. V3-13 TaxID=2053728 RepID=UPI000C79547B|nr:spore germination protein [Bacillus sp. V3-13]PLR79304.1 spore germination protein [Bacillus sp. V3-13]